MSAPLRAAAAGAAAALRRAGGAAAAAAAAAQAPAARRAAASAAAPPPPPPPPPPAGEPLSVGFIGVGNMGGPMAACLLRAGHRVTVFDRSGDAVKRLTEQGAAAAGSPREIAETPGVAAVISMLPSTEHVRDAYEGPEGVLRASALQPPLLIDCSTISPLYTQELAQRVAGRRLAPQPPRAFMPWTAGGGGGAASAAPRLVDAPVSGGVAAARDGSLTFMCGGPEEAVGAARALLGAMGARLLHLGGPGLGQAAKLCNNVALAVQMAGVSEALALGIALGLDPGQLSDVMSGSSARCWTLDCYSPVPGVMPDAPSSRGYTGGFSAQLMLKDLRLAMELASATRTPAPMAQNVSQLYRQVVDATAEGRPLDFSAIFKYVHSSLPGL
ncbi:3-hydroxyisobutyrate dehydrogenase [Raphidocelis subcapitata]|uniref:3-hydroxyisobutyrate dehydrogenase n=1 Tax=Raphidocelis subcapitata TaxID=307507 RepID=A0A2V0P4L9_9CHLO|nr:3-hydroxyisobutyrate dehydrogenase [Raphidocelis subcapitata]|eukprot:GBF92803.1 3-hydroxyisobutyrate dehydrogenase [Raphidocelis subcapitata]